MLDAVKEKAEAVAALEKERAASRDEEQKLLAGQDSSEASFLLLG